MKDGGEKPEPKLDDLIPLEEAAALSNLSHGHLALLIRKRALWGIKIGRNWVTTRQAVEEYLSTQPKPGRKH